MFRKTPKKFEKGWLVKGECTRRAKMKWTYAKISFFLFMTANAATMAFPWLKLGPPILSPQDILFLFSHPITVTAFLTAQAVFLAVIAAAENTVFRRKEKFWFYFVTEEGETYCTSTDDWTAERLAEEFEARVWRKADREDLKTAMRAMHKVKPELLLVMN